AVLRGTLITNDTVLSQKIQDLGVSNEKPVVVFGNPPSGWGEEGRIVWMLRSLGHTQAVMVDGGIQAMSEAGITIPSVTPATMTFTIERNRDWSIQKNQLKTQLASDNLIVIDSREPREFSGSTPYGEQRGGHIPGAVNLYFKDLLDADGKLLPKQTLLNRFESLDITPETTIVVYCTGGIRSGWLAAVLISLGLPAQNYAGSMWEWSASPADEYPLERQ
ncbi:MAG: rhodanese-like domain-containing protein, partial [Cyanobacteria bacterium J06621_11]